MIAVKSQREHFLAKKLWIQILMWAFFGKKVVDSNPKVSILRQKKLWVQILMWAYYGKSNKLKTQCEHFLAKSPEMNKKGLLEPNEFMDKIWTFGIECVETS